MYLQLHDGPTMAQQKRYPNVPDLQLPEFLKIPSRQIMIQAAEEAAIYASKRLEASLTKNNTTDDLPTLDLSALENLEYEIVPEENNGMGLAPIYYKIGAFLLANWQTIVNISKNFARTIRLVRVNNRLQTFYEANYYQVQNLNNMTPQQIDQQLAILSGDYLNATADKERVDAMTLSRIMQVYEQRKIMLPVISSRTLTYIGGALLAYYLLKPQKTKRRRRRRRKK